MQNGLSPKLYERTCSVECRLFVQLGILHKKWSEVCRANGPTVRCSAPPPMLGCLSGGGVFPILFHAPHSFTGRSAQPVTTFPRPALFPRVCSKTQKWVRCSRLLPGRVLPNRPPHYLRAGAAPIDTSPARVDSTVKRVLRRKQDGG
jgi:hypothetical protein